uniref:Phosphatidylinositol-4,5-bisphosphate 4-phosphatase n=1 Tax=Toxocara canis TaxID=6265 RepID=A0A183U837_TOXCA
LQKTEYPRNVPGPTYACPHCEGTFLYHRPNGLVECPFCYATISIGHYVRFLKLFYSFVRLRALSQVLLGLFLLLGSISFFTIIAMGMSSSQNYFFIAGALFELF